MLTICMVVGVTAACLLGGLSLVVLSSRLERIIYYALFAVLLAAALAYNLLSAGKGAWLYRKIRGKRDDSR